MHLRCKRGCKEHDSLLVKMDNICLIFDDFICLKGKNCCMRNNTIAGGTTFETRSHFGNFLTAKAIRQHSLCVAIYWQHPEHFIYLHLRGVRYLLNLGNSIIPPCG